MQLELEPWSSFDVCVCATKRKQKARSRRSKWVRKRKDEWYKSKRRKKRKEFAKQDLSATISSHTTREEENLISGRTSRVKVEAGLREGTRDQSLAFSVIVDANGDDVLTLAIVAATVGALNGRQVGSAVSRERFNALTLVIIGSWRMLVAVSSSS